MLSIENPPLDPSSLLQIHNTNNDLHGNKASSSSSSSSHNHHALQQEADLLKSSLDATNPVPEFSIRNYVFGSRRKDLSKNWPFSEKNLQLCMKHGISDPLPPFQTPHSVKRNPFLKRKCSAQKIYLEEEEKKICDTDHGEIPKTQNDDFNLGLCKQNLAASDCPDINSSGSEEIDTDPVPTDTFLESEILHTVRKCKLVVKVGNKSDPSTSEEITLLPKNHTIISESMASKVCPVCKNFSSSSNTTLNAHIDQCLSGESTMKWAPNSTVIKYRVKPRKTRLMVDIYESAPYCTLEELERRNGRSWATNSSFEVQEGEVREEEKVEKVSHVSVEDKGREGDVYIDTDGTKVRILSKFSGVESGSKIVGDDIGARKILKVEKGNNLLSIKKKKKKLHGQKQQKFLRLGENPFSRKYIRNSEVCFDGQERNREKVDMHIDRFKDDHKQMKGNSGTTKQLSRSILTKTSSGKDEHRYSGHNSNTDSVHEPGPSSLGDPYSKKRTHFPKNPISSSKCSQKTDISSAYEPRFSKCREQPPRERNGFSLSGSQESGCGKRVETNVAPVKYPKPSSAHHGFSSKARKLSSFKKKCSALKKSVVHFESDLDEDELVGPPKVSIGRAGFFRSGKKRGATDDLEGSLSPPQLYEDDDAKEKTNDFSFRACSDSEATSDDDDDDEEFANEETQMEQNVEGGFMCLNESLGPEFHKLDNPHDDPLHPMERIHVDEQEIQMVAEIEDSRDSWQRNYFSNVDSISIPGPPGSFLPSLEDLGSEDFQGNNSSLTTSRVQSSEEHQDIFYRDSSDSLVSANSTISNPSLAGSDSRSSEMIFRVPLVEDSAPVNTVLFPEKRLRNDQPCCCSRKETASQGGASAFNYQDSPLLRRWSAASVPLQQPPTGKQWVGGDLNRRLVISNSRTEILYPPAGPGFPMKVSDNSDIKFPTSGCSAGLSPTSNYPVLRLMGKNLMVVNKDQDLPLQQRQHFDDDRFSNNFISHVDPNMMLHASRIPSKTGGVSGISSGGGGGGGFAATLEKHKYEGGIQFAN